MTSAVEWEAAKTDYPVGAEVHGKVVAVRPFGMFVEISGRTEITAVVDAISYYPDREPLHPDLWPAVGDGIEAVVSEHAEHNRQIKLRVG